MLQKSFDLRALALLFAGCPADFAPDGSSSAEDRRAGCAAGALAGPDQERLAGMLRTIVLATFPEGALVPDGGPSDGESETD